MRRTVAVVGVAGALMLGQAAVAGPAGAERNCSYESTGYQCSGGVGERGGGFGLRETVNYDSGDYSHNGGAGAPGGGSGGRCSGNAYTNTQRCVGSAYMP